MIYHVAKLHSTFVGSAYLHSNILSIRLVYRHSYHLTYFFLFHLKLTIAPPNISTNEFTISHKWNSIYDERENDANNIRKTWYGESAISERLSSEYSFSLARFRSLFTKVIRSKQYNDNQSNLMRLNLRKLKWIIQHMPLDYRYHFSVGTETLVLTVSAYKYAVCLTWSMVVWSPFIWSDNYQT